MTIPKNKLDLYNTLQEPEHIGELETLTGLSRASIYNILKTGKCKQKHFVVIKSFFDTKKEELKALLK